jgi:hypothetical protein
MSVSESQNEPSASGIRCHLDLGKLLGDYAGKHRCLRPTRQEKEVAHENPHR